MGDIVKKIGLMAILICSPVFADNGPPIAVLSFDNTSCGVWVGSANNEVARAQYISWFRGFVSGHNFANRTNQVPLDSMRDEKTLALYIDKYCRENPLNPFVSASFELVQELRPKK